MILPLPTFVFCKNMDLFKGQENIVYNEDSRLTIDDPRPDRYNIFFEKPPTVIANEIWVSSLEEKIAYQKLGVPVPIIIMTKDKELLPFCLKDRLVSLQDRMNKHQI